MCLRRFRLTLRGLTEGQLRADKIAQFIILFSECDLCGIIFWIELNRLTVMLNRLIRFATLRALDALLKLLLGIFGNGSIYLALAGIAIAFYTAIFGLEKNIFCDNLRQAIA